MKRKSILIKISLALCIFALLLTIVDYLALHDIWHDYVSKEVIESHSSSSIINLPEWSETNPEWQVVNISGLIKIICLIFTAGTLLACLKYLKKKD